MPDIQDAALVDLRHLAVAQLLHRRPRLAGAQRRHRRPVPRRRGLRPHHHEAGPQGPGPPPAGRPRRSALREPVQPARRLRLERQPLPRAPALRRPPLVRRVLRLRRAARLLARRDLRRAVRSPGGDAREGRQPLARDAVRGDEPAAVGRRSAAALEGLGRVRPRGSAHEGLVGARHAGANRSGGGSGHDVRQAGACARGPRQLGEGSCRRRPGDRLEGARTGGVARPDQRAARRGLPASGRFQPTERIRVEPGRGWLLVIDSK